jgi:16S rRNA G966 N2-methylase RsmD
MTCCHRCITSKMFDSKLARRELRRFQRRGPDAQTKRLLAAIETRSLPAQPTLLDIGGGIGAIHHELLERGFAAATHVDASEAYLTAAEGESKRRGHGERVRFQLAEFPLEAEAVPPADVVTLDRVVCCDPDYARMLGAAAARARRLLAFSYPRPRWLIRLMVATGNGVEWLKRSRFRAFVHPPDGMHAILEAAGMRPAWAGGTWIWAVEVFERAPSA